MRKIPEIPKGLLHKSGEDYLEAILVLEKLLGEVRSVDIARYMHFSRPSVSNAISVLRRAGHLTVDANHLVHLTPEGRVNAERVYECHRLLADFFIAIGVCPETAEADACKLEHLISAETVHALKSLQERMGF